MTRSSLRSTGADTIAAARPGEAAISIGADRPSSSVCPRSCQQQFREKEMSTSASSRSAAQMPAAIDPVAQRRRQAKR